MNITIKITRSGPIGAARGTQCFFMTYKNSKAHEFIDFLVDQITKDYAKKKTN